MQFEVQIPQTQSPEHYTTFIIEEINWLFALRGGLNQIGETLDMRNLICEIIGDNDVRLTESASGRTFSIKKLEQSDIVYTLQNQQPEYIAAEINTPIEDLSKTIVNTEGISDLAISDLLSNLTANTATIDDPNNLLVSSQSSADDPTNINDIDISPAYIDPPMMYTPSTPLGISNRETRGYPINITIPSSPPELIQKYLESADEMPFTTDYQASSDALLEEDLSFAAPITIDADSKSPTPPPPSFIPKVNKSTSQVSPPTPPPQYQLQAIPELDTKPLTSSPQYEQPAIAIPDAKPLTPPPTYPKTPPPAAPTTKSMKPKLNDEPIPPLAPILPPQAPKMAPTPNRDSRGQSISISDAFGSQGKYNPGMTTEILADAFMRAMDIYEYGEDRHAAMQFVIDLALNNVNAMGGAVLLTDLNQPMSGLWFEVANGPGAEELLNFRIPFGKGIIGYCAQEGVSQIIPNAPQEPRFKDDVLHQVGINIGSMLCTPIQHQKRTFGVITLYKYPDLRPFTRGESSILEYLAHTAGEYIYNLVEKADN